MCSGEVTAEGKDIAMGANNNEEMTLEEMMEALEKCTEKMEAGEMTLDESFVTFKEGMELVRRCNESIDKVEKEVVKLMDDGTVEPLEEMDM